MTPGQCISCKHLQKGSVCKAFLFGIPDDILDGRTDHSKPIERQGNKYVFEPDEELERIMNDDKET
jgi:hypothetical protein